MKAIILIVSSLLGFVTAPAWAAPYERNTARPVDQVVFGQVDTVRNITQRQVLERIHQVMKPKGQLFVGHSENFTESRDLFALRGKTVWWVASVGASVVISTAGSPPAVLKNTR